MSALNDVLAERVLQDTKWGEQNHEIPVWLAILLEEIGEVSRAWMECHFGNATVDHIRDEAVHVAAVALAIVECLDRNAEVKPNV